MRHEARTVGWKIRFALGALAIAGAAAVGGGERIAAAGKKGVNSNAWSLGNSLAKAWDTKGSDPVLSRDTNIDSCQQFLAALTRDNTPDSVAFDLTKDIPGLKAGSHPWKEGRAACDTIVAAVKTRNLREALQRSIEYTKADMNGANHMAGVEELGGCKKAYDAAIEGGLSRSEQLTIDGEPGGLQEMYDKWCVAGQAKVDAAAAERAAPYKKVLKADKLQVALQQAEYLMLPGGGTATPARLAAANVWFTDASPFRKCPDGQQVHVLHRYQFNGQQKLVSSSDREFCGVAPASAFH